MRKVYFGGENCGLEVKQYTNGSPSIQLYCDEGPMARATIALDYLPEPDHIFLKDYSENKGIALAFSNAGLGHTVEGMDGVVVFKVTDTELLKAISFDKPIPKGNIITETEGPEM